MKRILNGKPFDIIDHPSGFILVLPDKTSTKNNIKLSYRLYDFSQNRTRHIFKNEYLETKFGPAYSEICHQIKDYISCSVGTYKDKLTHVIYPTGEMGTFDYTGTLVWTGDITYHESPIRSIAMEGSYLWFAVPDQNAIVRYSTKLERVDFRIGGLNTNAFGRPMSVTRVDSTLFVCCKTSNNIKTISLDNYTVSDYRNFEEPVLRYIRVDDKEIVVLSSGVYLL